MIIEPIITSLGFIFALSSIGFIFVLISKNRAIYLFKIIVIGQILLFSLIASLALINLSTEDVTESFIAIIHKIGLLSGHFSVFIWFIIIERIEPEESFFRQTWVHRLIILIIGLSIGINFLTLSYTWSDNVWIINYHPLGFILLALVYGSLISYQYKLLYYRIQAYTSRKSFHSRITLFYLIMMTFALFSFMLSYLDVIPPSFWIFFGGLALFSFSFLLLQIPQILLTHEEPVLILIIQKHGVLIYSKAFSKKISINEDLIAGLLTAIGIFGSSALVVSSQIKRISYEAFTLLIKTINSVKFCYIFEGSSYYAPSRLEKFINSLQKENLIWDEILDTVNTRLVQLETNSVKILNDYSTKFFVDQFLSLEDHLVNVQKND